MTVIFIPSMYGMAMDGTRIHQQTVLFLDAGFIQKMILWQASMSGIEIKATKKRGGYVRNIRVRDCLTPRIMFHAVGYNDDGIGTPVPPIFEDCRFERLHITGECYNNHTYKKEACDAVELIGFDEPGHQINNILFRDITLGQEGSSRKQTISVQMCENVTFERIRCL